jgi:general secretion pathway protein D
MIRMEVHPQRATGKIDAKGIPQTNTAQVSTNVMVPDGTTLVIGGLIDDSRNNNETKVPGLGDIPLLGWLFKTQSKGEEKTNLYIFLTPRVIKNPAEADRILSEKRPTPDNIPAMLQKGEITLENPSDAARPSP